MEKTNSGQITLPMDFIKHLSYEHKEKIWLEVDKLELKVKKLN
jgi:hypothetical protein